MTKKILIIDYGMGNLRSVQKAFERVGAKAFLQSKPTKLEQFDAIVLPGVGAFGECMRHLKNGGWVPVIQKWIKSGKPFLGICLGLQLLFEKSEENPGVKGLGVFGGSVRRFRLTDAKLKIPHMGWNELVMKQKLNKSYLKGIKKQDRFYFVHSYFPVPKDTALVATTTVYGSEFCSSIASGSLFATQFHPEKSGQKGLQMLKNFMESLS